MGETPSTPPFLRCPQTGVCGSETRYFTNVIDHRFTTCVFFRDQKSETLQNYVVRSLYCSNELENVSQTDPTLPITKIEERTPNNTNSRTKAKKAV